MGKHDSHGDEKNNIMEKIAIALCTHLEEIRFAMAGTYRVSRDMLIDDFIIEFYDTDNIPTVHQDRENLRKDRNAVSSQLKKAVEDKKLELSE